MASSDRPRSYRGSSVSRPPSPQVPTGPLSGPSTPEWRRARLLRIGSSNTITEPASGTFQSNSTSLADEAAEVTETSSMLGEHTPRPAYGAANRTHSATFGRVNRFKGRLPALPGSGLPRSAVSNPATPPLSPSSLRSTFRQRLSHISQRPIAAYDEPLLVKPKTPQDAADGLGSDNDGDVHARTNGIRVWYSSFTSIDWLHDAVKDSVRFSRLRRGKSLRSRLRLLFDKSLGWIIVTIVGFLTAVVAFLVVRSEQWLFHIKDGYCSTGWYKAQRFCCGVVDDSMRLSGGTCSDWRTWSQVFEHIKNRAPTRGDETDFTEYIAYTVIALLWATISTVLTIYLTSSTSFITRKESGVLGPQFDSNGKATSSTALQPKWKVMYYAAGSGIPEIKTILGGFVIHGYLGWRTLFTKSVGLSLSVASGLSLGKEGPFVHIASCIGNIVSRITRKYENNEAKRREILSAACAAGVAVAFGAPIGGTLFSLEEVSYFFPPKVMWRSFFCAMIAAITLKFLDPFGTGKLVLFQVTYDKDWHAYELIFFVILGAIGGIYGAYFSKLNYRWSRDVRNKTWMKTHPIAEVVLITLVTTFFCFLNPYTRMGGTELVYELFSECRTGSAGSHSGLCVLDPGSAAHVWPIVRAILVAMLVKGVLTIVTFGIKLPAGIFIPTLGVGACAGRILGIGVQWAQWRYPTSSVFAVCRGDMDCVIPGLYAMVGAAAALSGVTRTTVSLAVIMFELTDTLTYAVPVMLAVLVAKTVADALEPKGIYDLVIDLQQLPYLEAKHEYMWNNVSISEVTDRDVDVIYIERTNTVRSLRDQLQMLFESGHDDGGFPILKPTRDGSGTRMVGYIGASELEHALSIVADDADEPVQFHASSTYEHQMAASFSSSFFGDVQAEADLFDFSVYMDQAPLTIQSNAPMELLHQHFAKLGAKYVVVTDVDGDYEGVIDKKTWLAFLSELEEKS